MIVFFNIRNKDSEKPENIGIETVLMIQVFFLIRNMSYINVHFTLHMFGHYKNANVLLVICGRNL